MLSFKITPFQSTYLYKVRLRYRALLPLKFCFNPRTYIRYDFLPSCTVTFSVQFQSTYLYKVRLDLKYILKMCNRFQSTYLYKVRPVTRSTTGKASRFQSTYLYKVRPFFVAKNRDRTVSFNPRTYIRYDTLSFEIYQYYPAFQSTYLYKVRHSNWGVRRSAAGFQSTYLYKVRLYQ